MVQATNNPESGCNKNPAADGTVDARFDSIAGEENTKNGLWDRCLRWSARWPLALGFLCEIRSFGCRMAEARRLRLYQSGLTVASPSGFPQSDNRRLCSWLLTRNWDTQHLIEMQEWVGLTDVKMFLLGWDRGAEWGLSESSSQDSCNEPKP